MGDFVEYIYIYISESKTLPVDTTTPLTTFWTTPGSEQAKVVGMGSSTGLVLVGKRSTGEIEVIGREYGAVTQEKINRLYKLIDAGPGNGGGEGGLPMGGQKDTFVPGMPNTLFNSQKTLSLLILIAFAVLVIMDRK